MGRKAACVVSSATSPGLRQSIAFLYASNPMKGGTPETRGHRNHHPLHAAALKKRAEEVGIEAEVHAEKIGIEPANPEGLVKFFLRHLSTKPSR